VSVSVLLGSLVLLDLRIVDRVAPAVITGAAYCLAFFHNVRGESDSAGILLLRSRDLMPVFAVIIVRVDAPSQLPQLHPNVPARFATLTGWYRTSLVCMAASARAFAGAAPALASTDLRIAVSALMIALRWRVSELWPTWIGAPSSGSRSRAVFAHALTATQNRAKSEFARRCWPYFRWALTGPPADV
jgi:hypothetical protein